MPTAEPRPSPARQRPPEALDGIDLVEDRPFEPIPLEIRIEKRPLTLGARVTIFILGWALILIGVAGLVLPGIQGVVTIVLGAALLSLDNELVYRGLRAGFRRWPNLLDKLEHFREKSHDRIHRLFHREKSKPE
jgi:hypothetical protein